MNNEEQISIELETLYTKHPDGAEARVFMGQFNVYVHVIDDIIDGDRNDNEYILGAFYLALEIYSCNFYRKYQHLLYPTITLIHHTYADSVKMERSGEQWQKETADTLRSVGQEMCLLIINILGGYEKRRELSLMVREFCYRQQHDIKDI